VAPEEKARGDPRLKHWATSPLNLLDFRRAKQAAEKLGFFKIRRFRSRFGVQQTIKKIAQSVCRASYDIDDLLPFRMSEFFRSLFSPGGTLFVSEGTFSAACLALRKSSKFNGL
jgi:hypothetical protein